MNRQQRVWVAALVGLLLGLGTLAAVVVALRAAGSDDDGGASPDTGAVVVETGSTGALPPVETEPAEVVRTIEVGGFPNALAVGDGGVWVVRDGRRVIRIDPLTDTVVARIGAGDELGTELPCGAAVGAGAVWVTTLSGQVARIGVETNRLSKLIDVDDAACIAVGAGGVWVTSPNRELVSRIDPETGEVVAEISVGGFPQGVTTGFGSVWVASADPPDGTDGAVTRIDRRTNEIAETIPVEASPEFVATGADAVWVSGSDGAIRRIDPRANAVAGDPIPVAAGGRTNVAVGGGTVWATVIGETGPAATVSRFDPATGEPVGEPVPVGESPLGLAYGSGSLWVANYDDGTVTAAGLAPTP